ncbi:MAG: hypothetical protein M5R42_18580 [Rhodocyclaceae bacterium]|nr:hypothetical protein [Rhodocyclaceae bacterium]
MSLTYQNTSVTKRTMASRVPALTESTLTRPDMLPPLPTLSIGA